MDEEKSKSGPPGAALCGRCHVSEELELQARSMILGGSGGGGDAVPPPLCNSHNKHCCCKLGRHTPTHTLTYDAELIALDPFSRSKKIRRGANGRFVPSDAKIQHGGGGTNSELTSTVVAMEVDSGGNWLESDDGAGGGGELADSSLIPGLGDDVARLCLARLPRSCYGQFYTVSKRFCSLLRSGELYSTRRGLGISEQWVYLLNSGQSVWRAFCLVDGGRWRPLPPTPSDPCFNMCDKESLTAGTQLLVVGREINGHCIWGYDLLTDRWFRAPQMNTRRCLYASASCGTHAFVAGGIDSATQLELRAAERYDSSSGRWEALPDMIKPRKMCSGFYMDGKFYVIGGANAASAELTCGEEFDPDAGTWREIPGMCPARSDTTSNSPPLVAVVDNQLFSLDASSRKLKRYCKRSNSWRVIGDVPVKADSSSGWGMAFKAVDGQLLLIGGDRRDGDAIYAWKPCEEEGGAAVNWKFIAGLVPPGTFVFNCAVMSA
ncbi:F-box/kelch-repeat protein At5g60570 [Selaginella moellendorffii]|nr:F-box/kelch-repeat protein At5g60570 [Selaginella moellendorffii]|eukprot:XP_002963430.2 F-box/kelch-repeat protein At5g60570 [Selaginella moellendorffii]